MTLRSYFGKMNSTLGSVVPLAMFAGVCWSLRGQGGGDGLSFCQVAVGRGRKHILIIMMITNNHYHSLFILYFLSIIICHVAVGRGQKHKNQS